MALTAGRSLRSACGAGSGVPVPHQGKRSGPTDGQREHNRVVNATRALAERGFSVLETWTIFRRARRRPALVGQAALALHVNEQR